MTWLLPHVDVALNAIILVLIVPLVLRTFYPGTRQLVIYWMNQHLRRGI